MWAAAPFLSDIPAAEALATWLAAVPERLEAVELELADALGRVTAAPVWALRSSPAYDAAAMDGIAVRATDTFGATETSPAGRPASSRSSTPATRSRTGCDAVVMREHVHWQDGVPEVRAAAAPWQHVRTIGEDLSATELLLPEGHRLRPVDLAAAGAAGHTTTDRSARAARDRDPDRRRGAPARDSSPGPGELVDTNSLMLAAQAREVGCTRRVACPSLPGRPRADRRARYATRRRERTSSSSSRARAPAATITPPTSSPRPARCSSTASPSSPATPSCSGTVEGTAVLGAPGYPVSASLTFEIFALPLLAALEGAAPVEPATSAGAARAPAGLLARVRRLDPRTARPRRRRARRHAAAARRGRAHLAGARRRPARRSRGARGPRRRRRRGGAAAARPRRRRAHDRRDRLPRPRARPRRFAAARPRPGADAGERPGRVARRARRVCATVSATSRAAICSTRTPASTRCRGSIACCPAGRRGGPARPSRAGLDRRRRQSARRSPGSQTLRASATSTGSAALAPACCSTTSWRAPASTLPRSTATSARSRRISRSPPRSPPDAPTPASA